MELVADVLGMPAVTYEPVTDGYPFHPGRAPRSPGPAVS